MHIHFSTKKFSVRLAIADYDYMEDSRIVLAFRWRWKLKNHGFALKRSKIYRHEPITITLIRFRRDGRSVSYSLRSPLQRMVY